MPDLTFRFDDITERIYHRQLKNLRELAASDTPMPDKVSLEIGSNRGKFLREIAQENPDRFYCGIELRPKYAKLGRRDLEKANVTNALLVRADANLAIPLLFDDGQIDEFFLLFPDPWWKARHHKRRVIQPDFLDLLARKMPAGGHVWIRTDVGPLADAMRETMDEHPEFEILPVEHYPLVPFPRTTREVKIIEQGLPIHALYYTRR